MMTRNRVGTLPLARVVLLGGWAMGMAGCGDPTGANDSFSADSITLSPAALAVPVNAAVQLSATLFPLGLATQQVAGPCSEWWVSDDPTVVAVDTTAFCQPRWSTIATRREGTATVTASFGGQTAATTVTVLPGYRFLGLTGTCALSVAGTVHCWGANDVGQLGIDAGADTCGEPCAAIPKPAAGGGRRFTTLASGDGRNCAVAVDGPTYCWGRGYGPTPVAVPGGQQFVALALGQDHGCGLTAEGAAYCWGENSDGQLGNGTTLPTASPVRAAAPPGLIGVAAAARHSCALDAGGNAYCWGFNGNGELGDGTKQSSLTPVRVTGGHSFATLGAGGSHTCGLTSGGAAFCWGSNVWAALGTGMGVPSDTVCSYAGGFTCSADPLIVSGDRSFSTLAVGATVTCGTTSAGVAYCWGRLSGPASCGGDPPLCMPTIILTSNGPERVPGAPRFAAAGGVGCWMGVDDVAYCWNGNVGTSPERVPGQAETGWWASVTQTADWLPNAPAHLRAHEP